MLTPPAAARPLSPFCLPALLLVAFTALVAQAQTDAPVLDVVPLPGANAPAEAASPAPAHPPFDNGLTAWMLVSSAFVLLMVPGLALFYGGMVRAKNVLNMFLCCMVTIGVIGLHWVILGYAIAFPANEPLITWGEWGLLGFDPSLILLRSFTDPGQMYRVLGSGDLTDAIPTGVPELAFVMFQGKFAIITPALIVGAVAERVRFGPFILFCLIWTTIVYCPIAYNVWNVQGALWNYGVLDFAGGTVVHVLAGVSALALTLVIGPRLGYGRVPMPPHSLGLTLIGAGLLWFGWFGFNAGSTIAIPGAELADFMGISAMAFTNTQVAAAAAATAWMIVEWMHAGKPTILGFASGMVGGLVTITPCAGHVTPAGALLIGAIGGLVCYGGCRIKNVFKFDDSLDAFGVHGVGGALGALLVGIFAIRPVIGGAEQFMRQLVGLAVSAIFAFVLTYVIALIIHKTIGLRVSREDEIEGLDITVHGESGYNLTEPLGVSYDDTMDEGHPDARGTAPAMAR
ncbi:MAG TPA: ammonium transporter [Tepidisphaeraceae bacterium]|nr:ammonium transporter [Tepidisphaeraceae bacterium]